MSTVQTPNITVRKLGIVARDYNVRFENGHRDFSYVWPDVLALLDKEGCDAVLFSLYTLEPRPDFDPYKALADLRNINMVCVEEFQDRPRSRKPGGYVVYHWATTGWQEYRVKQAIGKISSPAERRAAERFVRRDLQGRVLGNCALIICGESNIPKYDKAGSKQIIDPYGLRAALPPHAQIILNPVHDRMSRPEMTWKRRFLSECARIVVSVWNRGKHDINGHVRDGANPPWTVFMMVGQ